MRWETDDILWISQAFGASDDTRVMIDKTCDFGATWSGALQIGGSYVGGE